MKKLVVFTGAGVSADSGLATFRDSDGTWGNYRIEEVCIPEALDFNRRGVIRFYNERRAEMLKAEPNAAHRAIAGLERDFDVRVITQNVDNLHERAGSTHILHLHGELTKLRSTDDPSLILPTALPTVRCCVRTSSSSASRFPNSTVRRNLPPGPTS